MIPAKTNKYSAYCTTAPSAGYANILSWLHSYLIRIVLIVLFYWSSRANAKLRWFEIRDQIPGNALMNLLAELDDVAHLTIASF